MFKSIRFRLTLYFSLLLAMILLGTSYLLYQNANATQISNIDSSLNVIINDMIIETEETMLEDNIDELSEDIRKIHDKFTLGNLHLRIVSYDIKSNTQSLIAQTENRGLLFKDFNFKKAVVNDAKLYMTDGNYRVASKLFKIDEKTVFLAQAVVLISQKNSSFSTLIVSNIIILLFAILGSYILISKTLLSVHTIIEDVNQIKGDDYKTRVCVKNVPNEIKELVDMFNKLLVRHEESFSKISQFSSDVSHELKTPLTTMRGEMEVGLRRERSSEEYKEILKKSISKIMEIQELIDGLLFLAKSDKLKITSSFEEIYVDEVISESVAELEEMAHKKSILIDINLIPLTVKGNSRLLKIACTNLVKNAILYSPNKTEIKVSIEESSSQFIILFQDQGVGIAKEDMEYIFDRFYRVEKIKSRASGGTGLGLSIVKMILDIHGFDIAIASEVGRGTLVSVLIKK